MAGEFASFYVQKHEFQVLRLSVEPLRRNVPVLNTNQRVKRLSLLAQSLDVQVKSGKVNAAHVRELRGTVERDGAALGAFITLKPPTRPMLKEAASAGFYVSPHYGKFPRLQILTAEGLLGGTALQYPHMNTSTFKKAVRQKKTKEKQLELERLIFKR